MSPAVHLARAPRRRVRAFHHTGLGYSRLARRAGGWWRHDVWPPMPISRHAGTVDLGADAESAFSSHLALNPGNQAVIVHYPPAS